MFKRLGFLSVATLVVLLFTLVALSDETADDHPWADWARTIIREGDQGQAVRQRLTDFSLEFANELNRDATDPSLIEAWGRSLNYDELAKGEIVAPAILDELLVWAGAPERDGRITHAGVEHTYGYLFSLLETPFGFKRARWVQGEIDAGFGLPRGTLGPIPNDGTLLANATVFFGSIAFRGEASRPAALDSPVAADAVRDFGYGRLKPTRLTETAWLEDGTSITLRTDFVPFLYKDSSRKNSHLLVYSVSEGDGPSRLITGFPVGAAFVTRSLDPQALGENRPIVTRYNAYVEGFGGAGTTRLGTRVIVDERL